MKYLRFSPRRAWHRLGTTWHNQKGTIATVVIVVSLLFINLMSIGIAQRTAQIARQIETQVADNEAGRKTQNLQANDRQRAIIRYIECLAKLLIIAQRHEIELTDIDTCDYSVIRTDERGVSRDDITGQESKRVPLSNHPVDPTPEYQTPPPPEEQDTDEGLLPDSIPILGPLL